MYNEDSVGLDSSRRMPIVFCLDVSPSMGRKGERKKSPIDLLNEVIGAFLEQMRQDQKMRASVEIAFIAFCSDIVMNTVFEPVTGIAQPKFTAVADGGTGMAAAVIRSLGKLEERRRRYADNEIGYYAPHLVLITDGDPDKNDDPLLQNKAMSLVKEHCYSRVGVEKIIVPIVIGVGNHADHDTLEGYSSGFHKGMYYVCEDPGKEIRFRNVFHLVADDDKEDFLMQNDYIDRETIKMDMNKLLEELVRE